MTERFFPEANYTPTPNAVFDEIMLETTSLAELKVTLALVREIYGRNGGKRATRLISLSRLEELTGLSRQSCQQGAQAAMKRGFIGRKSGPGGAFVYAARVKDVKNLSVQDSRPGNVPSVQESRPPLSIGTKESKSSASQSQKSGSPSKRKDGQRDFEADSTKPLDAVIVELFERWKGDTNQPANARLTNKRAGILCARLREQARGLPRESALAEARTAMLEAIEGWANCKWYREREAFAFSVGLESYEKVEKFRGEYRANGKSAAPAEWNAYDNQIEREDPDGS